MIGFVLLFYQYKSEEKRESVRCFIEFFLTLVHYGIHITDNDSTIFISLNANKDIKIVTMIIKISNLHPESY